MADPNQQGASTSTSSTTDGAESPFVDDIIIWADGLKAPRQLSKQALLGLPQLDPSLLPPINSLIQQGVTIAAIPTTSGIGAACYLVNLATIKKPDQP
jgi:hypothetical protein